MTVERRKRGRPRVHIPQPDVQDEASVRRVQARLAQRAYRLRRDAKAEETQANSKRALKAAWNMWHMWRDFSTFAEEHGLSRAMPEIGQRLAATDALIEGIIAPLVTDTEPSLEQDGTVSTQNLSENGSDRSGLPIARPSIDWKAAVNPLLSLSSTTQYTYSIQETSFHRRLFRASVERVFHLLSRPSSVSRSQLDEVLHIPLSFTTPDTLRLRAQSVLLKGLDEELDTQYYSSDDEACGYRTDVNWLVEDLDEGIDLEHDDSGNINSGSRKSYKSFRVCFADVENHIAQQQWLMPRDVEQYLKSKGLGLNGSSLTSSVHDVKMLLPVHGVERDHYCDTPCDSCKSKPLHVGSSDPLQSDVPLTGFEQSDWVGAGDGMQHSLNVAGENERSSFAWVNVDLHLDQLVNDLVERSFCLGVCPGFSKQDVDKALQRCLAKAGHC